MADFCRRRYKGKTKGVSKGGRKKFNIEGNERWNVKNEAGLLLEVQLKLEKDGNGNAGNE
jgi:hypothetical protein